MGEAGKTKVRESYSLNKTTKMYENLYREVFLERN